MTLAVVAVCTLIASVVAIASYISLRRSYEVKDLPPLPDFWREPKR